MNGRLGLLEIAAGLELPAERGLSRRFVPQSEMRLEFAADSTKERGFRQSGIYEKARQI
ncbi:hypothetical protein [Paraburkholderia rhizosphaerae]|uniref:hypothetical protein n=1 Tax=Paraburkholderia rhizosphaerae TaxID=480658 RepID=UPI001416F6FF|nr:hypothetical protein [Paraburkholderia rhizosphaerae]